MATNSAKPRQPCRVLLVDDHRSTLVGLAHLLSYSPELRVVGAVGNCQDALQAVASLSPDVVVLDLELGDGTDGFENVRQFSKLAAVIVFSSLDSFEARKQASEAGAKALVSKFSSFDELLGAVMALATGASV